MKLEGVAGLAAVVVGVIGLVAIVSAVSSTYARETSGMRERWGFATQATDRDQLTSFAQQIAGTAACTPFNNSKNAAEDPDGDGLFNNEEAAIGSDPNKTDSDNDEVCDGIEMITGSSPIDSSSKPYYESNVSSSSTNPALGGFRGNGNDYDNDGLPNATDPDPTNPDTDGDGTLDGKDVAPTDPTLGGLETPPVDQPPAHIPQLILEKFYKVVSGPYSEGKWSHVAEARVGNTVNFRIHAEVFNEGGTHSLVLEDYLPGNLTFVSGTFTVNNREPAALTYEQLRHREVPVASTGKLTFDIAFSATATNVGIAGNEAAAFEVGGDKLTDKAFVNIRTQEEAIGGGFGNTCVVCSLYKYGRIGSAPWSTRVKANTGNTVEFSITVEGSTPDIDKKPTTILLTDTLPAGLKYLKGTSRLLRDGKAIDFPEGDDWLTKGILLTPTSRLTTFELRFSAKVETSIPFSLVNTAQAVGSGRLPVTKTTTTKIVSD